VLDVGASTPNALTTLIRWGYTGQEWIEALGLYDYNARLYDPVTARFLSPDPKDETPSPYMYVAGDPVDYVDPDGRIFKYVVEHMSRRYGRNYLILSHDLKYRAGLFWSTSLAYGSERDKAAHISITSGWWGTRSLKTLLENTWSRVMVRSKIKKDLIENKLATANQWSDFTIESFASRKGFRLRTGRREEWLNVDLRTSEEPI
jgi:RHS repeat-associated protein